jgi:hypothetical protein
MSAAAETQAGVAPAGTTTRKPRVSKPRAASTTTTRGSSTAASASPAATKTRGAAAAVKEAPEVVDPYAEVVWRKVQVRDFQCGKCFYLIGRRAASAPI